nr:PLDc N-terminal domain-containing protein [Sediminicola sp. YIK13]
MVYCLIDILKNKFVQNDKIVWLLVVILLPILGSVLYVSIGRKKKLRQN